MSLVKYAANWGVQQAYHVPSGGRLLITGAGVSGWGWDVRAGYPNWGYTQATVTKNEEFTRDALRWLTGKSSDMNILLYQNNTTTGSFGPQGFQNFVTRSDAPSILFNGPYGPWSTSTGLSSTLDITDHNGYSEYWTLHDWSGHDPTEYDLVIISWAPSVAYHYDGIDAYLQYGGKVWGLSSSAASWERYGFGPYTGSQTGGTHLDSYLCYSFPCPELGTASYQYGIYTTEWVYPTTNTMGGTVGNYDARLGLWGQYTL